MLSICKVLRGVSPFSIFLMDQKNNPALKGASISKRAHILSKMYKELSQKKLRELQKRAEIHPSLRKKNDAQPRRRKKAKSGFSTFVKANYSKVKDLNFRQRFSALSQLYELQKPVDLAKELKGLGLDEVIIKDTIKEIKDKGLDKIASEAPKVKKATRRISQAKPIAKHLTKSSTKK